MNVIVRQSFRFAMIVLLLDLALEAVTMELPFAVLTRFERVETEACLAPFDCRSGFDLCIGGRSLWAAAWASCDRLGFKGIS
jgi:hypothetical protein